MKNILFNRESSNWRQISGRFPESHLIQYFCLRLFRLSIHSIRLCILYVKTMYITCLHLIEEEQKTALCSTLTEILESACASVSTGFCLVTWAKGQSPHTSTLSKTQSQSQTQDMPESSKPLQEQQPSESCICHIPCMRCLFKITVHV